MLYWTCPTCGANLDLGEVCEDCKERETKKETAQYRAMYCTVNAHQSNEQCSLMSKV